MDALDTLFSILPVAFVVIWVLRGIGKARNKNRSSGPSQHPKKDVASSEKRAAASSQAEKVPGSESLAKWIVGKARETGIISDGISPDQAVSRGEDELYKRMDGRRIEPAEHHPVSSSTVSATSGGTHRMVSDIVSPKEPAVSEPAVLGRIASLPPLAQGVLWSAILDKPLSLKDSL